MKTVTEIVESLGGLTVCANACFVFPSAVSAWRDKNYIKPTYHDILIKLGKSKGIALTREDFPAKQSAKAA